MSSEFNIVDGVYQGPEVFEGALWLMGSSKITTNNLRVVKGSLSLGNLHTVKGNLVIPNVQLRSLGKLHTVEGNLDISGTLVTSLGNLHTVEEYINLPSNHDTELFTTLKDVQKIIATLKAAPLEELVTMLADNQDIIYQTIIKERLQNG